MNAVEISHQKICILEPTFLRTISLTKLIATFYKDQTIDLILTWARETVTEKGNRLCAKMNKIRVKA
jgi:hypothetical protein